MKSNLLKLLLVMSLCLIPSLACAYTIDDTGNSAYWGGQVINATSTAYGDVIGAPFFNIDKMDRYEVRKRLDCHDSRRLF